MAETYTDPATGKVYTGLQAFNMKKKAAKAAEQAGAAATNGSEPAPSATQETAPKASPGRPKLNATAPVPAPAPTPAPEPEGPDYYTDIIDAVRNHNPDFMLQTKTESKSQYFERLLQAVLSLPESDADGNAPNGALVYYDLKADTFMGFQPESLAWINSAVEAFNNKQPMPDLPGFVDKFESGKPAKAAKAPKAPKEKKVKAAKVPKEKKVRTKNENGFVRRIKRWVVANYDNGTIKDLQAHVDTWEPDENGRKPAPATLAVIYSSAREVIELAKAAGHWK